MEKTELIEIKNFTLHYDGMYSIKSEKIGELKVCLLLSDLMRLFKTEGYSMDDVIELWNNDFAIPFEKAIIKLTGFYENGKFDGYLTSDLAESFQDKRSYYLLEVEIE